MIEKQRDLPVLSALGLTAAVGGLLALAVVEADLAFAVAAYILLSLSVPGLFLVKGLKARRRRQAFLAERSSLCPTQPKLLRGPNDDSFA